MAVDQLAALTLGVFLVAGLYSSVGHAGASGYIAVMTLAGLAPAVIKPSALALNILVASIAAWQFWPHFSWRLFWPFALLAVPCAFLGGYVNLPTQAFKMLVGIVLLFSAARFLAKPAEDAALSEPSPKLSVGIGAGLGLLAGLTGTGGGIFLTPLLLLARWATTKQAAAVSAMFILANSAAGLLGNLGSTRSFPTVAWFLVCAALAGGLIGSHAGSKKLQHRAIKRLLAVVLLVAGLKLLFT